jgi:hypothetical protein
VQALNAAGVSSERLTALTAGKKIDHPAVKTQEVTVNQPAPVSLPSVDTTGAATAAAGPTTFAQQLATAQPVPNMGSTEASLDAQATTPPAPTDPAETADAIYQQFMAAMTNG